MTYTHWAFLFITVLFIFGCGGESGGTFTSTVTPPPDDSPIFTQQGPSTLVPKEEALPVPVNPGLNGTTLIVATTCRGNVQRPYYVDPEFSGNNEARVIRYSKGIPEVLAAVPVPTGAAISGYVIKFPLKITASMKIFICQSSANPNSPPKQEPILPNSPSQKVAPQELSGCLNPVDSTATDLQTGTLPIDYDIEERDKASICTRKKDSPLVLDLAGNGIDLTSLEAGVRFNLDADAQGIAEQTSWTKQGSDDAFLALDRNENGTIDSGSELFGNHTQLRNGKKAANGFEALADSDDNRDGFINSSDRIYSKLLIWSDLNHNGKSEPNELSSLAKKEVKEIDLHYVERTETDPAGNETRQRSFYKTIQGESRRIVDIWFVTAK